VLVHEAGALGRLDPGFLDAASVVVVGHDLPEARGPLALERLRARGVEAPVVFVLPTSDARLAADLLEAGADEAVVADERDARAIAHAVRRQAEACRMRHENLRLHHELTRSLVEVELKNAELERLVEQLEQTVRTDELTGLASRRWLDLALAGHWAEATRHDLPLAFVMIDLDGFKRLNDEAGHQAGDEMLRLVGRVLEANCRDVDLAARYGGDEFSILLPHTGPEEAVAVASRVLAAFRAAAGRAVGAGERPPVAMSVGVAHVDRSRPVNAEDLVRHADEAMYAAKSRYGGDGIAVRHGDAVVRLDGPATAWPG
jgi:diguanylate cyclase (GGDEF)-like protein